MQIKDKEVLRIFQLDSHFDITLLSFFNDNPVIKSVYHEKNLSHEKKSSKFILSEDSDEIAVIGWDGER